MEDYCKKYPKLFYKVPSDWILHVHQMKKFQFMRKVFENPGSVKYDDNLLQERVMQLVSNDNPYFRFQSGFKQFPGPMASNLSIATIPLVRDNEYFITEKSDGIRTMMYSVYLRYFPRWSYVFSEEKNGERRQFEVLLSCVDSAILESYFILGTNKRSMSQQPLKPHTEKMKSLPFHKFFNGNFSLFLISKPNLIRMKDNIPVKELAYINTDCYLENDKGAKFRLVRREGYILSYLFDRTFRFYLCLEEFVVPTRGWMDNTLKKMTVPMLPQRELLLDGELVFCIPTKKWNYSVYDVVTFDRGETHPRSCNRMNLSEKIRIIPQEIVDPHHFYYIHYKKPKPTSLNIIRKRFYKKSELSIVFNCIQKEERTGEYVYKKYNKNDGLIFTPDKVEFYHFAPGPCMFLLKWKWNDKLTCDFQLKKVNEDGDIGLFFDLNRKAQRPLFYMEFDSSGLSSEEKSKIIEEVHPVIAECFFDVREGWKLMLTRGDKVRSNTFLTISSVLVCLIEDVTKSEIINAISLKKKLPSIDEEFEKTVMRENKCIHMAINVPRGHNASPMMCVYAENSDRAYRQFVCPVKDCLYYDYEEEIMFKDASLEKFVIMNYSQKKMWVEGRGDRWVESCARCIYLPSTGKWKIVDFEGEKRHCTAKIFLVVMEEYVKISKRIRNRQPEKLTKRVRAMSQDFERDKKRNKEE